MGISTSHNTKTQQGKSKKRNTADYSGQTACPAEASIPIIPAGRTVTVRWGKLLHTSHRVLDPQYASDQVRRMSEHDDPTFRPGL